MFLRSERFERIALGLITETAGKNWFQAHNPFERIALGLITETDNVL